MKTFMMIVFAALALGLGPASAAKAPGKAVLQVPAFDGVVPNEEDRGRRFMRSWRDQDVDRPGGRDERSWAGQGGRRVVKGQRGSEDGRAPAERSWRDDGREMRAASDRPSPAAEFRHLSQNESNAADW